MIFQKFVEGMYRKQLYTRYDENGTVFYFSAKDFPGLEKEPFSFVSSAGNTLCGAFYYYGNKRTDKLVVFDHGLGCGHRAYMREIEVLAANGCTVYSYDHTGCALSGGENTNGFSQSLSDLNDCLNAIKGMEEYSSAQISVVGHSWGAFSTMNICALHPDVRNIVAMSGFVSVKDMVDQNFGGILRLYRKHIMSVENAANPKYVDYSGEKSLAGTNANVLLIHSSDDKVVSADIHFAKLRSALAEKKNIRFLLVDKKGHNPNYTEDAVKYKDSFFAELTKKLKAGELASETQKKNFTDSFDWKRMTEQDSEIWQEILAVLDM